VDRLIDSRDNTFVLSTPSDVSALAIDPQLIQDITCMLVAAAGMKLLEAQALRLLRCCWSLESSQSAAGCDMMIVLWMGLR
jgi:hypothetical protein